MDSIMNVILKQNKHNSIMKNIIEMWKIMDISLLMNSVN